MSAEERTDVIIIGGGPVGLTAWYSSLAGPTPLHGRLLGSRNAWGGGEYAREYAAASPCTYRQLAQIRLEPLLRAHAAASPHARVNFGTEVVEVSQDDTPCGRSSGRQALCGRSPSST